MSTSRTERLNIHFEEYGSADGDAVLLLHGWPDDASTWNEVVERLAPTGLRFVVPTLRGFGETTFKNAEIPRTGNSGILAMDAIDLVNSLGLDRFSVVGHDWGSNIAEALAVGWPERVARIALLSSSPRLGGMPTPPFKQAQRDWYHWFMATERGAKTIEQDRRGFTHLHWENWAPDGWFDEATFDAVARAFDNPDWVAVTLHSYRSRWDEETPDPASEWLEQKVKQTKTLSLPAIFFQGDDDGVNPPATSEEVHEKFTGSFERILLQNVGHFPQREDPETVARNLHHFLLS